MSPAGDCGGGRSSPFYRLLTPPASCCWLQATLLAFLSAVTQQSLLTAPVDFHRNLPLDVEIPSIRDPVKILRRIKSFYNSFAVQHPDTTRSLLLSRFCFDLEKCCYSPLTISPPSLNPVAQKGNSSCKFRLAIFTFLQHHHL